MKTVTLFRHAKSGEKDNPAMKDFERPLAPRGVKVAPKMGRVMRERKLRPDLILCSPSVRTRETLSLAGSKAWDAQPGVRYDERLYEAAAGTLLEVLRELPDEVGHVMIVGHNPGLQELAVALTPAGTPAREAFKEKLATAAVVSFDFDTERWRSLRSGTGQLQLSISPNML
jgi:phosphohistidine phosphatase